MTISIFVVRDRINENVVLSTIRGPDIVDPLISNELVARERGRKELDDNSGLQEIQLQTVFRSQDPISTKGVRLGQTVLVHDELQGGAWRGKISGIRHSNQGGQVITDLTIQRPASGFVIGKNDAPSS
jgi:hypothetical protein